VLALLFGSAATAQAAPQGGAVTQKAAAVMAGQPPVFNNYLVCFNGWMYTDYTDPDGNDANLNVWVWVYQTGGRVTPFWLNRSGPGAHGVFFYLQWSAVGINPAEITGLALIGYDETGLWSTNYTNADGSCNVV
jgi:hypothetical protein